MRRLLGLLGLVILSVAGWAAPVGAAGSSTVETCPIAGVDPDTVTLTGPAVTPAPGQPVAYTVTADESPGEGSHVVTMALRVSSSDGGQSSPTPSSGANSGFSPTTVGLQLEAGHQYTVDWVATFDFGIHPCSSVQPGESAFSITT